MNKSGNTSLGSTQENVPDGAPTALGERLGIAPLNARSVMLSALLGTHPPALPAKALVALGELFGIRPGTARTSLSRMVTNGELVSEDGWYRLTGRLLDRQHEQDVGRQEPDAPWDRSWITVIAAHDRRSMAERRAFRELMSGARLAELRPDIWMRPANLPTPTASPDLLVTSGPLASGNPHELVARLWPLDELEARARRLTETLSRHRSAIDTGRVDLLPENFLIAAATVRFLRTEPQLPTELTPAQWSATQLRPLYDDFDAAFQGQLRNFFASVR